MSRGRSTVLAVILVLLTPVAANAVLIEITGAGAADGWWELSTVVGVPGDATLGDILDNQVWWGDSSLAEMFAEVCGSCLGTQFNSNAVGPWFSYEDFDIARSLGWGFNASRGYAVEYSGGGSSQWLWVTAVSVPEPGTLALLGIGLFGMGFARRKKV